MFVSDPKSFEYSIDDNDIIHKLVKHVKHVVDFNGINSNLGHFKQTQLEIEDEFELKCRIDSQFGSFFRLEPPEAEQILANSKSETHDLLGKLLAAADTNLNKPKNGYRFDKNLKSFASYIRMLGGRLLYETIQRNLPLALPTLSSVDKHIQQSNCQIMEGVLRTHELKQYLKERNLPSVISLSEDATRITGQVQYDAATNQLIGFVLPLDCMNGMPSPCFYRARHADEIYSHFTFSNPIGHYVNVLMAQPLANVAPFCLLIFASDNKYTANDVSKRWNYIVDELLKVNIEVLVISSDSDPRFNSAMRRNSTLGMQSDIFRGREWFSCGIRSIIDAKTPIYIQDTIHVATKLRNFMLRTNSSPEKLPFGKKFFIKIQHLHFLIDHFPKDLHELTASTLNPSDKQNFSSVERMCHPKVIALLKENVEGSEATVGFLKIMHDIIAAFRNEDLTPLQRISKIWYCVFLIRMWKMFICSRKNQTIKDNFLTQNCYVCIELNAHGLVLLLLRLQSQNKPELFVPTFFESQPCEQIFRQIRSFTSTYSTVANCSMKEIIGRINKIQLQNDISLDTNFVFPRVKNGQNLTKIHPQPLPSLDEICAAIEESQNEAFNFAVSIGLIDDKNKNASMRCTINPLNSVKEDPWYDLQKNDEENKIMPILRYMTLKNFSKKFVDKELPETSSYVAVSTVTKGRVIIKKSSLCWLLRKETSKLSSDRLQRVKSATSNEIAKPVLKVPIFKKKRKTKIKRNFVKK